MHLPFYFTLISVSWLASENMTGILLDMETMFHTAS